MQLQEIFETLETMREELKISDIHISLTTLEKVFLKMTQQSEKPDEFLSPANGISTSVSVLHNVNSCLTTIG
jgi:hypothetical protein